MRQRRRKAAQTDKAFPLGQASLCLGLCFDRTGHLIVVSQQLRMDRPRGWDRGFRYGLRRSPGFQHVTRQQIDRPEHPDHHEVSRKSQKRRRDRISNEKSKRRSPSLRGQVGNVKFGHDLSDLAPLRHKRRCDLDHLNTICGSHLPHRKRAFRIVCDQGIHRSPKWISRSQNISVLIRNDGKENPPARGARLRAIQRIINLPDVSVQGERAKGYSQTFDMQPGIFLQPVILKFGQCGQNLLRRDKAKQDHKHR